MKPLPFLLRTLITGLAGATAADVGRTIYQALTGFPPVNWSITGRWFLMVLSGQPHVPDIGAAASLPHELIAGHAAYYTISVVFAGVYLVVLRRMKREPSLWNGDRKSTRLNSSHLKLSRMPSSA